MVDGLEGRRLLSAQAGDVATPAIVGQNPLNVRAFSYYTRSGARVTMELKGSGNLNGTSVDADGALNVVYGGTNAASKVYVVVGRGTAPLRSIQEASLPTNDYTGIGGQLIGTVLAPQLDLVAGGQINMTSGVGRLQLRSLGANTEIHLRDLPQTFPATTSSRSSLSSSTVSTVSLVGSTTSTSGGGGTVITGTGTSGTGTTGTGTGTNTGTGTTGTGTGTTGTGTGTTGTGTGTGIGTGTGTTGTGTGTTGTGTSASGTGTGAINPIGSLTGLINNPTGIGVISPTAGQSTNNTFTITSTTTVTGGNGNPVAIPPGEEPVEVPSPVGPIAPTSYSFAGRTQTYSNDPTLGGTTLTGVTGQFAATPNLITTPNPANPAPSPQPPGVLIQLNSVNARGGQVGDGQIYGYDAVADSLVRFNAVTGQLLQAFDVGGTPTNVAGVGLGRYGREQVVLLARGTVVQAFDAATGVPVGSFSTAGLAPLGFNAVDGIGFTGTVTTLSDSSASVPVQGQGQGTTDFGIQIGIDVTASINNRVVKTIGKPFVSDNGFSFSGGTTGIPGTNNIYNFGAAGFNAFQAPFRQAGVLTTTGYFIGSPREVTRTVLPSPSNPQGTTPAINFGGTGGRLTGTGTALGSIEQLLAVDQGVANGVNFVRLYAPATLSSAGSVNLQDPDPIVSLSTTFHPELVGSALVDVQGNVQTFQAKKANGLALNVNGNLDLVQITDASNSTIIGQPLGHVQIARKNDVVLVTPNRSVGTRGGVFVVPGLRPVGPLTLPE